MTCRAPETPVDVGDAFTFPCDVREPDGSVAWTERSRAVHHVTTMLCGATKATFRRDPDMRCASDFDVVAKHSTGCRHVEESEWLDFDAARGAS